MGGVRPKNPLGGVVTRTPLLARCGPVYNCVGNVDNGIVEGKGVWNERRVSFRISALISANKHISIGIWHSLILSSVVVQKW